MACLCRAPPAASPCLTPPCVQLFALPRLATLVLEGQRGPLKCDDGAWPALTRLTALQSLRVANFENLPTGLVAALRSLTQLQELELADLREGGAMAAAPLCCYARLDVSRCLLFSPLRPHLHACRRAG